MTEYSTRKALIKNVSVECITVCVEQEAVIGFQLSIHTDPNQCNFGVEAIQHQIKTTQEVKAILRSDLGVFEGKLIGLKRLRGEYFEDANIPVFFMYIPFVSPLSSHAVKMVIASQLDPETLVLEIPDCYFTVEAW
jgi:hypothetical protein